MGSYGMDDFDEFMIQHSSGEFVLVTFREGELDDETAFQLLTKSAFNNLRKLMDAKTEEEKEFERQYKEWESKKPKRK